MERTSNVDIPGMSTLSYEPADEPSDEAGTGLVLTPFRALRPYADAQALAKRLCPPYDIISAAQRAQLLADDPENAVGIILPEPSEDANRYTAAASTLADQVARGSWILDNQPAIYVYEMNSANGVTRGLIGAVELREPAENVILPHENTMAGPVADRLALMEATEANLEPIYLVYSGAASHTKTAIEEVVSQAPIAAATTADAVTHQLWAITDPLVLEGICEELSSQRAVIADGHHRYATYLELQRRHRAISGAGPWDRGLCLLVDATQYGPQVHAIHRVITALAYPQALAQLDGRARQQTVNDPSRALENAEKIRGFATILSDGETFTLISDVEPSLTIGLDESPAVSDLDVVVLHRGLVERAWMLQDNTDTVDYAHSVEEALTAAKSTGGTAALLRPTPVAAVINVATHGERLPRKSTLFMPKPVSGLLIRRWKDDIT